MTEETKVEVEVVEPPVVSPHEEAAAAQGWVPKDEWVASGRAEDDWRPAKEFVDRGELFKSIHSTKRELKQTQAALGALQKHHNFVFEKAYQSALKDLKLEKRAALREDDLERVEAIEDEIESLSEQHTRERVALAAEHAAAANVGTPPEFQSWVSANSWYESDHELRDFADAAGIVYVNRHPESRANPEAVLQHVAKEVRRKFPEKFGTKKAAPNAVASVDRSSSRTKSADVELDDMERDIMRTLVNSGVMTEQEYKAELKKTKGL